MIFFWNNGWSVKVEERSWKSPPRDLNPGLSHRKSDAPPFQPSPFKVFKKKVISPVQYSRRYFLQHIEKTFHSLQIFFAMTKEFYARLASEFIRPKKLEVDRGRQFYFYESTKSLLSSFFCCPRKSGFLWVTWNLTEHFYSIHKNPTLFAF